MLNKFIAIGNTTKDIEIRVTQQGKQIGNFGFAVNESYKDKDGNKKNKTLFINCSVFGRLAELNIPKGTKLAIEGKLELNTWKDQQGNNKNEIKVNVASITFLSPKKQEDNQQQYSSMPNDDEIVIPGEEEMF
ncbi:MAG: single-stranded DNA-binding protein [Lutibacter sp.]|jgi:single-strand DNA-binding protein